MRHLLLLLAATAPLDAQPDPLKEDVAKALKKATAFFSSQVASHGG